MSNIISTSFLWNVNTFPNKKGPNGLLLGLNCRAYFNKFFALLVKSDCEFPPRALFNNVMARMRSGGHNIQIRDSIVAFVSVFVMNYLCRKKFSPKFSFHDKAVIVLLNAINYCFSILVWAIHSLAFISTWTRAIICFVGSDLPRLEYHRTAAIWAGNGGSHAR